MRKMFVSGAMLLALVGCSDEAVLVPNTELATRSVQIVNNSELGMSGFNATPTSDNRWGHNRLPLPARMIAPGGAYTVHFSETTECEYDFRAEYFGSAPIQANGVNICEISQYVFTLPPS